MRLIIVVVAGWLIGGCALLQKGEPLRPQYLTPADPSAAEAASPRPELAVRLRRIKASRHLGERIVVRDEHQVRFLEERRWTDPPPALVEERLAQALFEEHGLTRVVGGVGVTLEVKVQSFELVLADPPVARIELTALLHDERHSIFQETLVYEEPTSVDGDGEEIQPGDTFAEAMGRALDSATEAIASRVETALARRVAEADEGRK